MATLKTKNYTQWVDGRDIVRDSETFQFFFGKLIADKDEHSFGIEDNYTDYYIDSDAEVGFAVENSSSERAIIGTCKDVALSTAIEENCNDLIMYENRRIGFSELKAAITKSRYVLFPYIGSSVSSSGALIDTICLGGVPVGPNKGAFKDLEREGVCLTYKNDDEMMDILLSEQSFINEFVRQDFIKNNSWQSFAQKINDKILNVL